MRGSLGLPGRAPGSQLGLMSAKVPLVRLQESKGPFGMDASSGRSSLINPSCW